MKQRWWLFAVLVLTTPGAVAIAQSTTPRIVDCHVHYNGDPAFLQKLVAKLDSVEGMAFLLTAPADLESVKQAIDQHPNRLVGFGSIELDDPRVVELVDRFHRAGR